MASSSALQLLQQHIFAKKNCGQTGSGGQLQIKVSGVAIVSDQGWPLHKNAFGPVQRRRDGLFQRDSHSAGFRPAGSANKQALTGFQQSALSPPVVKAAQWPLQVNAVHLQDHCISKLLGGCSWCEPRGAFLRK